MIKAFIFDNENVIVHSDWDGVARSVSEMFHVPLENGPAFKRRLREIKDATGGILLERWSTAQISREEFWGSALATYGLEPTLHNIERMSSALENLAQTVQPEMLHLLTDLKTQYKLFLLSNSTPEIEVGIRQRHSYLDFFDAVYFSHRTGVRKPHADAYLTVLHENRLQPRECIFIDDGKKNCESARQLGIPAIQYRYEQTPVRLREKFTTALNSYR